MTSGPTHRRISRILAAPAAVAAGLISGDWYAAIVIGGACALSGCGPDDDQAEARLSLPWKVVGALAWLVFGAWIVWWLRDAPQPGR